jgi:hypothetical protein
MQSPSEVHNQLDTLLQSQLSHYNKHLGKQYVRYRLDEGGYINITDSPEALCIGLFMTSNPLTFDSVVEEHANWIKFKLHDQVYGIQYRAPKGIHRYIMQIILPKGVATLGLAAAVLEPVLDFKDRGLGKK